MRKLNNKGMTLIELLVCFIIVSAIVISMFNAIMSYQTEEQATALRSNVISYKNQITRLIQNDIMKGELMRVHVDQIQNGTETKYAFTLQFRNGSNQANNYVVDGYRQKRLEVVLNSNSTVKDYIMYQDSNGNNGLQNVKYYLMNIGESSKSVGNDSGTGVTQQQIKSLSFTSISTNVFYTLNADGSQNATNAPVNGSGLITGDNAGLSFFKLDIAISSGQIDEDYHIAIVAPLKYEYCRRNNSV